MVMFVWLAVFVSLEMLCRVLAWIVCSRVQKNHWLYKSICCVFIRLWASLSHTLCVCVLLFLLLPFLRKLSILSTEWERAKHNVYCVAIQIYIFFRTASKASVFFSFFHWIGREKKKPVWTCNPTYRKTNNMCIHCSQWEMMYEQKKIIKINTRNNNHNNNINRFVFIHIYIAWWS